MSLNKFVAFVACLQVLSAAPLSLSPFRLLPQGHAQQDATSASVAKSSVSQWILPTKYTNIEDAFEVSKFAWGKSLASVVTENTIANMTSSDDSILRVSYPKDSIDPKGKVQGGTGFYSHPIDIAKANNVTLTYQVWFPHDFDWVKGGKLPGLYGGRDECSGGDPAQDCFSTRMMFREKGAGELYLYAPVSDQLPSVCSLPPFSTCNPNYGSSLGRGSFTFKTGEWTTLRQDIWLNTPGKPDGGFNLWANGKLVLTSSQILYRNPITASNQLQTKKIYAIDALDDQFDPLLDGFSGSPKKAVAVKAQSFADASKKLPPAFVGIMFETFFGGHSSSYASTSNQEAFFKGVEVKIDT